MNTDLRNLPPQSMEAEMSCLGAIMVDNEAIDTAHEILSVDDFYRECHRKIFLAMSALSDRKEPIDLITMTGILKQRGELEEVGGGAYLATLVDFVPMAANIAFYCRLVVEKAQVRRIIPLCEDARLLAYDCDMAGAVAKLELAVQSTNTRQKGKPVEMGQTTREMVQRIEVRYENKGDITGLSYGHRDLDKATLGMQPGELIIIAGRPSMGKSALAGNIIKSACIEGKNAMLFSLEMPRLDIADRLAASFGTKYQNIRSGRLDQNEWPKLMKASSAMHTWGLHIDDTAAISLREVSAKARRQAKEGLDLVVVDYLQLMSMSDTKMSRVQGMGEISRGLKQLAKELGIPVVALSQLNRSVDARNDKRPMMSDLRESGEIEQDADVILFPYRPAAYCEKCKDRIDDGDHSYLEHQSKAEIIIEKQRSGERNLSIPSVWLGEFQRFEALSRYDD